MRHDVRSAAHALGGFVDLLRGELLGALSDEQRRALQHMQVAAERLAEIAESALELAEAKRGVRPTRVASAALGHVAQQVLYARSLAYAEPRMTFAQAEDLVELHVAIEPDALRKLLHILLEVALSASPTQIEVRMSRTDLHASLVLSAQRDDSNVFCALPGQNAASSDLEAMAAAWNNREYVRLKRCEALLQRHGGRLLVTADLARTRIMLPIVTPA